MPPNILPAGGYGYATQRLTMHRLTILLLFFVLTACSEDDEVLIPEADLLDTVPGIGYQTTENGDLAAIYDRLIDALSANTNLTVVAEVDHQANASRVGQTLRPTRVVLFGNPALGTPLLRINPQVGLDLPQKMLLFEAEEGEVVVAYNATSYLSARHGVGAAATLADIDNALGNLLINATNSGNNLVRLTAPAAPLNEGILTRTGSGTVDSVYAQLRAGIAGNANLTVVAEVDHRANALTVGDTIPPNRLIVFGNPTLGTPLLQAQQSIGLDLPQKMLVYQNAEGEVTVVFNDPVYLAGRHGVSTSLPELTTIREALVGLAEQAL